MARRILRLGPLVRPGPRFTAAQQAEPGFEAAAHVLEEGVAAAEILLDHLGGDLDLEARPAGQGEAFQGTAVLRERQMQPVQLRQMPGDAQSRLACLVCQGVALGHPP